MTPLYAKYRKEYYSWSGMKARCYNKKEPKYKNYGARGICVCKRWKNSFSNFLEDMGLRPEGRYSIDRIDVNKNYTPSNCRWATDKQQGDNKTTTRKITYKGKTKTITGWSEFYKIPRKLICDRLTRKWPTSLAITKPKGYRRKRLYRPSDKNITFRGKTQNVKRWSEETGIKYYTLTNRLGRYNWSVEDALTKGAKR